MKKRILSLAMVCLLTLGLSITSLAASVEAGVVNGIDKVTDKDGNDVTGYLTVTELTERGRKVAEELKDAAKLKELLESLGITYNENMHIIDMKEVQEVGTVPASIYPVTIKFNVKGITASTKVIVLRYSYEKEVWEVLETTAEEAAVLAKLSEVGPVVFIVDGNVNGSNSTTSPVTGQTNNYMWAFAAIALGVAGTVVLKKRA